MRTRRSWISIGLAATVALGTLTGPAAGAVPAGAEPDPGPPPGETVRVTLVTGDLVETQQVGGGRQAVSVRPGPGRERVGFHQMEVDGDLSVIPYDALPYLGSGRLDPALFNITELIEAEYDDAHRPTIPLIVDYPAGTDVRTRRAALTAAASGPALESIGARAVAADKSRAGAFWESVDDDRASIAAPVLAGGLARIRLDRRVRASLDRSVPQIGAPAAWQAGYDGAGVSVAVLDTGIDQTHPDLAGTVVEARNFTTSTSTDDRFGHGTHVASIVAGRGAGSTPARKGVAPGAQLRVGKVLDDNGYGLESWIVDGMEWAASSGAKVVNLSLGGDPTDGTDPMSRAVDALTASTGTLFVVSAGNSGETGEFSIGSPGAATSALTVGAVDRDESLASFSSRGPRLGDFAIKPDVTAPGVGIVAARAAGTGMGGPVDEHYTTASGTSMAAPHVAGAAAILAQQHPDWTAPQLKDALASTAVRNAALGVHEQGGGRIDLARATSQPVTGTATLDLGLYADGDTSVTTKPVSYRNTAAEPVTLALRLTTPVAGMTLSQQTVEVPAHGSATVEVRVDSAALPRGRHGGYLEATAGGTVVHTSVGVSKEAPRHTLTLSAVGPDGKTTDSMPLIVRGEDARFDFVGYLFAGQTKTMQVAEGTYQVSGLLKAGRVGEMEWFQIVDPELEVTGDTTMVLDARKANRITIRTPKPAVQRGIRSIHLHREVGGRLMSDYAMEFDEFDNVAVTPAEDVAEGTFEFGSRWQLVAPMLTGRVLGSDGFSPELSYLRTSDRLAGDRHWTMVPVGAGRPEDYQGRDVRGRIALIQQGDLDFDTLTANAAKAGAALALVIPSPNEYAWAIWTPSEDRLPTLGAMLRPEDGPAILDLVRRGHDVLALHGTPDSPYLYDVQQVSEQGIAEHVVHEVTPENSATVRTTYHESGGDAFAKEQRFAWRPWQASAINQYQRWIATPQVREEIVSAGDVWWQHRVKHFFSREAWFPLIGGMTQQPVQYRPGQRMAESWFAPLVRPAVPAGVEGAAPTREGDTLSITIPAWVDSEAGHYGLPEGADLGAEPDLGRTRFYRDGTLVSDRPEFAWGTFPAAAGPSTYRLELDTARTDPNWRFATSTRTAWTFRSERPPTGATAVLPMLQVDPTIPTDPRNLTRAVRRLDVDLAIRYPDGLPRPSLATVTVQASYDDGASWQPVQVKRRGSGYTATVQHPRLDRTNGYVGLRIQARDLQGNAVDQTVLRAYGLR